jgi:hypothetical protein
MGQSTLRHLQESVKDCAERGLINSSKWAAEQLIGFLESGHEVEQSKALSY